MLEIIFIRATDINLADEGILYIVLEMGGRLNDYIVDLHPD